MIKEDQFILRAVEQKDYRVILNWMRSQSTAGGFVNANFVTYDMDQIRNLFDSPNEDITLMVDSLKEIPIGSIIIRPEWENRNAIVDIIMSRNNYANMGIGFKALTRVIRYCSEELNLRRIEIKVAETNKVMMRLFRFFPKDESIIEDIINRKKEYKNRLLERFGITEEEYGEKENDYIIKYIKETAFSGNCSELVLREEGYMNGNPVNLHVNSFLINKNNMNFDDVLLVASGNFTKSELYKRLQEGNN